ncbi:MAG: flavodoxin [Eubacteriales bacterium]|jgi:flavodoxin/outer membrane murein-binding lipoprotein Lpp
MKKSITIITGIIFAAFSLAGCGSSAISESTSSDIEEVDADAESEVTTGAIASSETSADIDDSKILVIYFDQGMNSDGAGNTEVDAITSASLAGESPAGVEQNDIIVMKDEIIKRTGADEYPVLINETYAADYGDMVDVAQDDQDEDKQFTFRNGLPNISSYDTIFVGMPVWWGSLPQPMVNVFEQLDFSGKQIIPFGIHLGSGFGEMVSQIEEFEPDAEVSEDGLTISGHTANSEAETDVDNWLDESFPDLEI